MKSSVEQLGNKKTTHDLYLMESPDLFLLFMPIESVRNGIKMKIRPCTITTAFEKIL
jgi:hypothetical protein